MLDIGEPTENPNLLFRVDEHRYEW